MQIKEKKNIPGRMVLCAAKLSLSEILFQFLQLYPQQHSSTDGISLISHGYFLSCRSSSESLFFCVWMHLV